MVSVVVFEFSVMRCQPLRRALAVMRNYGVILSICCNHGRNERRSCCVVWFDREALVIRSNREI
nr:hypothetical protein [Vibrio cholerae]